MDDKAVLVRNLKSLSRAHGCDEKANRFADYINEKSGRSVIDRSYIARIFKHSDKDPANPTVEKMFAIASALNVDSWQLFSPLGFDSKGQSLAAGNSIDSDSFKRAVRYAVTSAEELEIDDVNFISEVALESYTAMIKGEEEKLGVIMTKLARSFG